MDYNCVYASGFELFFCLDLDIYGFLIKFGFDTGCHSHGCYMKTCHIGFCFNVFIAHRPCFVLYILNYVCYSANAHCVEDITLKVVKIVLHRRCLQDRACTFTTELL